MSLANHPRRVFIATRPVSVFLRGLLPAVEDIQGRFDDRSGRFDLGRPGDEVIDRVGAVEIRRNVTGSDGPFPL